ncbi:MAG TPA: glycosyl hydrolase [Sphingomonas sp.]|nr:glycosyl hydrolase [Sphingomonas sp.]
MSLRSFTTGAIVIALLLPATPVAAQSSLEAVFRAPPEAAKPRLRWWWPGGAVSDIELRREVGLLADAGFGGAEIQAFNTGIPDLTPAEQAAVDQYATPSFFAHVRAAADAAAARGMTLDYTFGSSWPSGGGFAITPERALVELTMAVTPVAGGTSGPIKVAIPARTKRFGALSTFDSRVRDPRAAGWIERFDARQRIVAVVAMKGSAPDLKPAAPTAGFKLYPWDDVIRPGDLDAATAVVLTDRLKPDGTLDWSPPPGNWQVAVFKQYASNMGVGGAAGEGPQLTLDHMSSEAFAAHAARVGDPLGNNPRGMRSTFVDSLELMQDIPWSPDFLAQFKARRGYDLTPYLPFVLQPGWMQAWGEHWSPPYFDAHTPAVAERVRSDYRRTVSDLIFEGFIDPFVAWNHRHGLEAKFQAHGGAIDIIRGYGIVDIPETEDLVDGGNPYFMRFARSGADLYGRQIVSAESLVWGGRPFDVTPDELRKRVDLLFAGGVNSLMVHGFNYIRGATWPGNHAFQPSGFGAGFSTMVNPSNPIWAGVPTLAHYIARTQAILQQGRPVVPVAYFYGRTGYYPGIEDQGAAKEAAEKGFITGGYDFDRINPDAIANARVVAGQLVASGGARYAALVLPRIDGIRAETAETITAFARAGLPVFFTDAAPSRDEGLADAAKRDVRVKSAIAAALRAGARIVPANQIVARLKTRGIPANLSFIGNAPSDLVFVQRKVGARTVTFVHNLADSPRDASLRLPARGGVTRWDAMTGAIAPVTARPEAGNTTIPLLLGPGETALLVLDPATRPVVIPARRSIGHIDLSNGWSLAVEGHAPRTTPLERMFGVTPLGDWRNIAGLGSFAGIGTYRRSFDMPADWAVRGTRVVLDLGTVHDMATVTINGKSLIPTITAPFRVDLTRLLHTGRNEIAIAVATTPQNAMIDPKAPGFKKLTSVPTGLIGPIMIEASQ